MNFVNEKNVALSQVCQDCGKIAWALDDRPRRDFDADAHLGGDDIGQGGFAQTRRAVQEDVVQRFAARFGCVEADAQIFHNLLLADIFGQVAGSQRLLDRRIFGAGG